MDNKLIITQYTDPMCIWCYGLEPSMRKINFLNPDKVEFHNVMGILVGNVKEIIGGRTVCIYEICSTQDADDGAFQGCS